MNKSLLQKLLKKTKILSYNNVYNRNLKKAKSYKRRNKNKLIIDLIYSLNFLYYKNLFIKNHIYLLILFVLFKILDILIIMSLFILIIYFNKFLYFILIFIKLLLYNYLLFPLILYNNLQIIYFIIILSINNHSNFNYSNSSGDEIHIPYFIFIH